MNRFQGLQIKILNDSEARLPVGTHLHHENRPGKGTERRGSIRNRGSGSGFNARNIRQPPADTPITIRGGTIHSPIEAASIRASMPSTAQ